MELQERENIYLFLQVLFLPPQSKMKKTSGVVAEILDVPKSHLLLFYQFPCSDGFGL